MKIAMGITIIIFMVFILLFTSNRQLPSSNTFGVTFSPMYAKYLKQDWQKMYISILDDLKVSSFRIPTYWSEVEKIEGKYDFSEVDFMVSEANKRGAKITLVVGIKQPRWPEYHLPQWAKNLTTKEKQEKALKITGEIIKRYQSSLTITAWQVENEPFVTWFGEGFDPNLVNQEFLYRETALVKSLDLPAGRQAPRPIIITDTGEWSSWIPAIKSGDSLGISVYRKAHNPYLGYITYPFFPWMYSLKSNLVRKFIPTQYSGGKTIISELQAEVWAKNGVLDTPIDTQIKLFTISDLKNNVEFARKTGFDQVYLWGVEWWYYMATNSHPEYLEYAKTVFK